MPNLPRFMVLFTFKLGGGYIMTLCLGENDGILFPSKRLQRSHALILNGYKIKQTYFIRTQRSIMKSFFYCLFKFRFVF